MEDSTGRGEDERKMGNPRGDRRWRIDREDEEDDRNGENRGGSWRGWAAGEEVDQWVETEVEGMAARRSRGGGGGDGGGGLRMAASQ